VRKPHVRTMVRKCVVIAKQVWYAVVFVILRVLSVCAAKRRNSGKKFDLKTRKLAK